MQRINLYRGQLLPEPEVLPLSSINISIIAGILLSALIWFLSWQQHNHVLKQQQTQLNQMSHLQKQLKEFQALIPTADVEARAMASINRLQNELQQRMQLSRLIDIINEKNSQGFSDIFHDLAQIKNKDLWFTRILVKANQINLEGKTLESASVANMVIQLQGMKHTSSIKFKEVNISRKKARDKIADFILYSDPEGVQNGL